MKNKITGKILDGGQCVCDLCGKTAKLGGFADAMSQQPRVACYECMLKMSAKEKGISVVQAEKERNEAMRLFHLFSQVKMEEYLAATGQKELSSLEEANRVIGYITHVWNTFSKKEKDAMQRKKQQDLSILFQTTKMNWQYLAERQQQRRNDPCACGSGKKYKVCCLLRDEQEKVEVERWKRFDAWVIRKAMIIQGKSEALDLMDLTEFYFGRKRLADAKKYGITEKDMEEFNEWLMNDYYDRDEQTPYVLSEMLTAGNLSDEERKIIAARIEAPKSVYIVTLIKKGEGALLRNVFSREEVFVHDIGLSESVREGYAVFVRIFTAGKYHLLSGGHMSYPPNYLDEKLKEILKAYGKSGQTVDVNKFLRRNGHLFGRLI